MPSSYSTNLRLELQATGENRATWGTKANNVFNMIEDALTSYTSINLGDSNHILTTANGTADEARSMFINLSGSLSATRTVTIPAVPKMYIFRNGTTGGHAVTIDNGVGSATVENGVWKMVWTDGTNIYASPSLSAAAYALTDFSNVSDKAAARASLGLAIGTDVQAFGQRLSDIAGLTPTDSTFIVGNGTNFVSEDASTARTSLGLGSIATQAANNVNITGGTVAGITDIAILDGGTGASSASAAFANLKQAATTSSTGVVEKATDAEVYAATADKYVAADHLQTSSSLVTISDASTIALDWKAFVNGVVEVSASRNLGNPTNGIPGQWRTVIVKGNNSSERTITPGNQYGGTVPELEDVTSTKWYLLSIYCVTSSHFLMWASDASPP